MTINNLTLCKKDENTMDVNETILTQPKTIKTYLVGNIQYSTTDRCLYNMPISQASICLYKSVNKLYRNHRRSSDNSTIKISYKKTIKI